MLFFFLFYTLQMFNLFQNLNFILKYGFYQWVSKFLIFSEPHLDLYKSCKSILSVVFFFGNYWHFCGSSQNFQAASLQEEVVFINTVPSIALITCNHQLLLSLAFITCFQYCQPSFSGITKGWGKKKTH